MLLSLGTLARADLMLTGSSVSANSQFQWSPDVFGPGLNVSLNPGDLQMLVSANGMSNNLLVQPQANGSAEGNVGHVRLETTIPSFADSHGSAMYSSFNFANLVNFEEANGHPSSIYYAYAWRITNLFPPDQPGSQLSYHIGGMGADDPDVGASAPADATGVRFGSRDLSHNGGGNSYDGTGSATITFGFGVGDNHQYSTTNPGGSAVFELWYEFSNTAINEFDPFRDTVPASVPESTTTAALLGLGMAGLMTFRRRLA